MEEIKKKTDFEDAWDLPADNANIRHRPEDSQPKSQPSPPREIVHKTIVSRPSPVAVGHTKKSTVVSPPTIGLIPDLVSISGRDKWKESKPKKDDHTDSNRRYATESQAEDKDEFEEVW